MNTREIGAVGEEIAARFLKHKGYKIIHRNWYCYAGEIDIIAHSPGRRLVFVEVKYVRNPKFVQPHELFSYRKQKKLLRAINLYVVKNKITYGWELDLICLTKDMGKIKVAYYKNVEIHPSLVF